MFDDECELDVMGFKMNRYLKIAMEFEKLFSSNVGVLTTQNLSSSTSLAE